MGKFGDYLPAIPAAAGQLALVLDPVEGTKPIDIGDCINHTILDLPEIATPENPEANVGRVYVKDSGGTSTLYFRDSSGVETDLLAGGGSGGNPSNIAYLSNAYTGDDPVAHTYSTLRGAVDNEPDGTFFIFKNSGDTFTVDALGGPLTFKNNTFLTEFDTGSVDITLEESIFGTLSIPSDYFYFYVAASIPSVDLELRDSSFTLLLSNTTTSVVSSVYLVFVKGNNTVYLGDAGTSMEPQTECIERVDIAASTATLDVLYLQADAVFFYAEVDSNVTIDTVACAYASVFCDTNGTIMCKNSTGFAITSYVSTPPVSSPTCFLTPNIHGKAKIILNVNPATLPDAFFFWYEVVGNESAIYNHPSAVLGELELVYPDETIFGQFDSTGFTSGMGMSSGYPLCPLKTQINTNTKLTILIDCYSDLYHYADRYFWFDVTNVPYWGSSPRIEIRSFNENYIYIKWEETLSEDISTKTLVFLNGPYAFNNLNIVLGDIMLGRSSEDSDVRKIYLVHDNINPMFGHFMKNATLSNGTIVDSSEDYFYVYPLIGFKSGINYADVIGWTHNLHALYFGDPADPGCNTLAYKGRSCTINYFWEGSGRVLIDGVPGTEQSNVINRLNHQDSGTAVISLEIITDYNRVVNSYIKNLSMRGSYNVVTGTEITTTITDTGTDNFVDPITNPGGNQWLELRETNTPANPVANRGRIYVKDVGGTTKLFFLDSSGLETEVARTTILNSDVSNPPTDAELNSIFTSPAAVGAGFEVYINDAGAGSNFYKIVSDGTNWWIFTGVKAI